MKIGMIGYSNCGKSSLFCALTSAEFQPGLFSVKAPISVVPVPDPRMEQLREIYQPKKFSLANLEFLDFAAMDHPQKKEIFAAMREADVLVAVLRKFENDAVPNPEKGIDPYREYDEMLTDFIISDLEIIENRISKLKVSITKPTKTQGQDKRELVLLEKMQPYLEEKNTLQGFDITEDDEKLIHGFRLLTRKPVLRAINVGLEDLESVPTMKEPLQDALILCASVEQELVTLPESDRTELMSEFGIPESICTRLLQKTFSLLQLRSFFTVGDDEVKSWTLQAGDSAWIAAGKIHSDIQRGFIRAEVVSFEDLVKAGDMKKAKAANAVRLEGKEYEVQDGEIVHFRFNV